MSNHPQHRSYPVFVRDQVLTHQQLNNVVEFLYGEDRLTRRWLFGAGIVCGLEVKSETNSETQLCVKLSPGCGITTDGHLIVIDQEIEYKYSRDFTDKTYFKNRDACVCKELLVEAQTGDKALESKVLEGHVVTLFLDLQQPKTRSCGDFSCNERGERCDLVPRALLIAVGESGKLTTPDDSPLPKDPKNLRLTRILAGDGGYTALMERFKESLTTLELRETLDFCCKELAPCLNVEVDKSLLEKFPISPDKGLIVNPDVKNLLYGQDVTLQYTWDWVRDLAATCRALLEEIEEARELHGIDENHWSWLLADGMPDAFAQHLQLGTVNKTPPGYRCPFIPGPATAARMALRTRARRLLERLKCQLRGFEGSKGFDDAEDIIVTPDAGPRAPLEQRAVAGYYDQVTRNTLKHARSHDAYPLDPKAPDHDLEDAPFFRIDGHLGRDQEDMVTRLRTLRDKSALPFRVITITMSITTEDRLHDRIDTFLQHLLTRQKSVEFREEIKLELLAALRKGDKVEIKKILRKALNPRRTDDELNQATEDLLDIWDGSDVESHETSHNAPTNTPKYPLELEHIGGVPRGGTFVLAVVEKEVSNGAANKEKRVVADFALPYYCEEEATATANRMASLNGGGAGAGSGSGPNTMEEGLNTATRKVKPPRNPKPPPTNQGG